MRPRTMLMWMLVGAFGFAAVVGLLLWAAIAMGYVTVFTNLSHG